MNSYDIYIGIKADIITTFYNDSVSTPLNRFKVYDRGGGAPLYRLNEALKILRHIAFERLSGGFKVLDTE